MSLPEQWYAGSEKYLYQGFMLTKNSTQNLHLLQYNIGFAKKNKIFNTKLKIFILVGIFTELSHKKIKT